MTSDGSKTIYLKELNEQYHSIHGAYQESKHVYIESGLKTFLNLYPNKSHISIMEVGFGTGLNAYLTAIESIKSSQNISYYGIEAHPVKSSEIKALAYEKFIGSYSSVFHKIHDCVWGKKCKISSTFYMIKKLDFFSNISYNDLFDIIYFDAFGPRVQPELWNTSILKIMYNALKSKGILTTYCSKGSVRRNMEAIGFKVERLPGPKGKREMLRATKP